MKHAQYLYRRDSGIYFVRFVVPARLREAVGHREIHRSTGCRDLAVARIVAAEMAAHWHRALHSIKNMDLSKVRAGSIDLLGSGFIGLTDAATALGTTALHLAERLVAERSAFYVRATRWSGWSVNPISELPLDTGHFGEERYIINEGLLGGDAALQPFTGRLRLRFAEEALAVLRGEQEGVCQFLIWPEREHGFVMDVPGQGFSIQDVEVERAAVEALRLVLAEGLSVTGPAHVSPVPGPAPQTSPQNGWRFSDLAEAHIKWRKDSWGADQLERRTDQCETFKELMNNPSLAAIDRAMVRLFWERAARLPANRHLVKRKFELKSRSCSDLIAIADEHNLPRLTADSLRRLLDGLSEVFSWGVREGHLRTNPAVGLGSEVEKAAVTRRSKDQEQRDTFSSEDLARIFGVEWFTLGVGRKTPEGRFFAYRPHYYWLPLLALYAGGRLNELSQLYLKDITIVEGLPCLDFNLDGEGKQDLDDPDGLGTDKSLKTVNAQRVVPVHARLVNLGLLDYIEALRCAGHVRLFPELTHDKRKGYGKAAGSWFNERFLGKRLEIPRNGRKTFHSFRHNFATAMAEAGIETTMKADFMGHQRSEAMSEARYDKGRQLAIRKQKIDAISYELPSIAAFDVQSGLAAVADALSLKLRHK